MSLAQDICNAQEAVLRVLSIEISMGGIAHLRDLTNEAPADVAHLLKDVWKEFLLRGVWNSRRCDWCADGVTVMASVAGKIEAAEAAKVFHASTRRRTSARNLRSPRARAVTTAKALFCDRQSAFLSSASLAAKRMSIIVATSSGVSAAQ